MNSTLVMKEARQMAWPWAVVTAMSLLSFVHVRRTGFSFAYSMAEVIVTCGLFFGMPLLAVFPLGAEFQYRTFGLTLAQPIPRRELWRVKFITTIAAILVPGALYAISGWIRWESKDQFWLSALVVAIAIAGAMFWTLVARSTIGGLALSICALGTIQIAWMYVGDKLNLINPHGQVSGSYWAVTLAVASVYIVAVTWAGRRRLIDFQGVEGMQAGDTVIPGGQFVPKFVGELFRARPTGAIMNLVRREFHLLRVVWALAVVLLADWIMIAALGLTDRGRPQHSIAGLQLAAVVIAVTLSMLIAVLSGTLSLGEEKNWGLHEWNMTTPVSARLQWTIKLLMAVLTSIAAAAGIPGIVMIVRGLLAGSALAYFPSEMFVVAPVEAAIVTLAAFWCACAVKGTIRATLWLFPLSFAIGLGATAGGWVFSKIGAESLIQSLIWRWDPVNVASLVSQAMFSPFMEPALVLLAMSPVLIVAIMQSFQLFRSYTAEGNWYLVRAVMPIVVTSVICGMVISAGTAFMFASWEERGRLARETHRAIEALKPGASGTAASSIVLTADELAKASPLSDRTRRWLNGASIDVSPTSFGLRSPRRGKANFSLYVAGTPGLEVLPYRATIRRPNGIVCTMEFATGPHATMGILEGVCE